MNSFYTWNAFDGLRIQAVFFIQPASNVIRDQNHKDHSPYTVIGIILKLFSLVP